MTQIVVDAGTRRKLRDLAEDLQFTDEAGRILGNFTPVPKDSRQPQVSKEEIERRLREGGGRPLAEIMSDLEKRA